MEKRTEGIKEESLQILLNSFAMFSKKGTLEYRLQRLKKLGLKSKYLAEYFGMNDRNYYKVSHGYTLNPRNDFELKLTKLENEIKNKKDKADITSEPDNSFRQIATEKSNRNTALMIEDFIDIIHSMNQEWRRKYLQIGFDILSKNPGSSVLIEIKERWQLDKKR